QPVEKAACLSINNSKLSLIYSRQAQQKTDHVYPAT
ncbi:uncharacterized protein METZ01_LOCUS238639, partial [marine metagenome]